MALSMEEQRILDEMERKLAGEDPRLAARLAAFDQPTLLGAGRARVVVVLTSLAAIVAAALMIYAMRPFPAWQSRHLPPAERTSVAPAWSGRSSQGPSPATASRPLTPHA